MAKEKVSKNSLMARLLETSTIKETSVLENSEFFNDRDQIKTDVPALNIALCGDINGGLTCGTTVFAGPSKHYKTGMGLELVAAYLNFYKDAVCIYYDSEHGSTPTYVAEAGVDIARVIHSPIMHIEQLKFDITKQLDNLSRGEKVIFFIDSLGNLASKKELDDALAEKEVADMTRAKMMKQLFRIITPYLNSRDVPCVAIAHEYKSQDFIPKSIVSGGTGIMLSANNVFLVTRAQEKDGDEHTGWKFTLNVEKSRFIKEKSKIPIIVTYTGGVEKWSGLLDLALEGGFVKKIPSKPTTYQRNMADLDGKVIEDKSWLLKDTNSEEFWNPVLLDGTFNKWIGDQFKLGSN